VPIAKNPSYPDADVIVVLGSRTRNGRPAPALRRRLDAALSLHSRLPSLSCIMSGGAMWDGISECQTMRDYWIAEGGDAALVRTESESTTTSENAFYTARLCNQMGYTRIILVTCDFHMARASRLFHSYGLSVNESPAVFKRSRMHGLRLRIRERIADCLHAWGITS